MSMSQFTLNNLYNQGILDYVPTGLAVPNMNPMSAQNYMNSAAQGMLYQNHNMAPDYFVKSNTLNNSYNAFGGVNENIISNNPQAGINGFGELGVNGGVNEGVNTGNMFYNNPQAGMNGFGGGFGKLGAQTSSFVSSIPNSVKGLVSGALIVGTAILCLKGKKKPPVKQEGFMSKLKFWKKKSK